MFTHTSGLMCLPPHTHPWTHTCIREGSSTPTHPHTHTHTQSHNHTRPNTNIQNAHPPTHRWRPEHAHPRTHQWRSEPPPLNTSHAPEGPGPPLPPPDLPENSVKSVAIRLPAMTPSMTEAKAALPCRPRWCGAACSTRNTIVLLNSPPTAKPCSRRRRTSRIGAARPTWGRGETGKGEEGERGGGISG